MKRKLWIPLLVMTVLALILPLSASAYEGYRENRCYYNQLDADERAVYDALRSLAPPDSMSVISCYVPMPQDTSRYSSMDFVYTAWYALQYDDPAASAWISHFNICRPTGEEVDFSELECGTPSRLSSYSALILEVHPLCTRGELYMMDQMIEGLADEAYAGMSRYDRAAYAQRKVSGRLVYDGSADLNYSTSPLCMFDGRAICEGFAKVYKILADKLDLPCVISGGDNHMYNLVRMEDSRWYVVEPQGSRLLHGVDAVAGAPAYYPQQSPAHWRAVEGHGAVTMPQIAQYSYRSIVTAPPVTQAPVTPVPVTHVPVDDSTLPYDMGIPQLNGRRFGADSMNLVVYWVQVQMKATGAYYTGDQWDETGNLGSHTRDEIKRFMRDRGYSSHDGSVDQAVVDALASYLGGRIRPVNRGGYYRYMDTLLNDNTWESMDTIYPNSRNDTPHNQTCIRWVQTALSMLGYYSGSIDGRYGSGTSAAVNAFQRDHGFQQREYVTYGVARAMLEACWQRNCNLSRLP